VGRKEGEKRGEGEMKGEREKRGERESQNSVLATHGRLQLHSEYCRSVNAGIKLLGGLGPNFF
jgi:hypothetical protein